MDDPHAQRLVAAGKLAANLAHDWNNVLTILAAQTAEIVRELPPDHRANLLAGELIQMIEQASDSPRRLLAWLAGVSAQRAVCDVNTALRLELPLLHVALGCGVQCVLELGEDLPTILLDKPLFLNAVLNVATNAVAAMEGRGTFTIRTSVESGSVAVSFADTGAGMDEETRRRIFEPFFTTRSDRGGMGLGLETVSALAKSHNASFDVETSPGHGCRLTIVFPALLAGGDSTP